MGAEVPNWLPHLGIDLALAMSPPCEQGGDWAKQAKGDDSFLFVFFSNASLQEPCKR